jgi:hypothetical protein
MDKKPSRTCLSRNLLHPSHNPVAITSAANIEPSVDKVMENAIMYEVIKAVSTYEFLVAWNSSSRTAATFTFVDVMTGTEMWRYND